MLILHRDGRIVEVFRAGTVEGDTVTIGDRVVITGLRCEHLHVPDQDVSHLHDEDGNWEGTLSDLRLYTKEEQAALDAPKLAREELAKTSATAVHSLEELAARVALIEKALGVG